MNKQRRQSKEKSVNPTFFIFCEGKTEEEYINFLRTNNKFPIEIDAKIKGSDINENYINNYKNTKDRHPTDKTYLIYDLDVPNALLNLQKIKNTTLIVSNPCFELWYLLFYQNQTASLTSKDCVKKLTEHVQNYKKGYTKDLEKKLSENKEEAIRRAKKLALFENPSTNVYQLVEDLEMKKYT